MKKENKDNQLKFRITNSEKEKIIEYCNKHNMTISDFCRTACQKMFQQ